MNPSHQRQNTCFSEFGGEANGRQGVEIPRTPAMSEHEIRALRLRLQLNKRRIISFAWGVGVGALLMFLGWSSGFFPRYELRTTAGESPYTLKIDRITGKTWILRSGGWDPLTTH